MVNYCCVRGCGRNTRQNNHLNYYSLPKEKHRQVQWLKAAGREDLLIKNQEKVGSYRFCSRHFKPASIKNKHLIADAVPTLCLPGDESAGKSEDERKSHEGILCNNCKALIHGFRYKCLTCEDYDLCQKCETNEAHPRHFMIRMPKPLKMKLADNLVSRWRKFFKSQHVSPDCTDDGPDGRPNTDSSDDDQPITKYCRNYDSGIDLSEDVKQKIRKEVARVVMLKNSVRINKRSDLKKRKADETEASNKRQKSEGKEMSEVKMVSRSTSIEELAFADVDEIKDSQVLDVKNEFQGLSGDITQTMEVQPVVHLKLSEDLSEIMIEPITRNPT